MGVRERRRKKEKSKTSEKEKTEGREVTLPELGDEYELEPEVETHIPEVKIRETEQEETTDTEKMDSTPVEIAVEDVLSPLWGTIEETEWMYSIPPRDEDKEMWASEWADFLLQWTEVNKAHIISLTVFIKEHPFKDILNKTKAFKLIASKLVDDDVAIWKDRKRHQLRVYWKPVEDWADEIYEWSIKTGTLRLDLQTIVIQHSNIGFASLPEEDIEQVLKVLVEREQAEWVDKKKFAVKIIV